MARAYRTPPSRLLKIDDPLTAWCLDQAIYEVQARLAAGEKLRPQKREGESNIDQLRRLGVQIKGLKE